ncbi:MAG: OB-fold domain-containing protein [bacterium]|nr:OB-fold domain-containing protein [bacterium]
MTSPAFTSRYQKEVHRKMQKGNIVSFTTVAHPAEGFGSAPLTIGLLELEDGTRAMGQLIHSTSQDLQIGLQVCPRMRLTRTTAQGLRIYDVGYEVLVGKPVEQETLKEFPGYILALTGPSGVGKSTISRSLVTMFSDYVTASPIVTTREPKDGDDGEYTYVTEEAFIKMRKDEEIIAATQIPSKDEKRWYGYRATDLEAIWKNESIPVVITEQNLLQELSNHYSRRSILSCGLLPPGKSKRAMLSQLLSRLRTRGRDNEQSIADRMRNAEEDLDFFTNRSELFDHFLVNEDLETVIETIKGHVLKTKTV